MSCIAAEGRHGNAIKTNAYCQQANISADLYIYTDPDGGAYALKLAVHNLSKTNDLVLRLFDIPEISLMVSIIEAPSDNPKKLSKSRPELKPYEYHFVEMLLPKTATIEWFIRLSDRLSDPRSLPDQMSASLLALFDFGYRRIDDRSAPESGFNQCFLEFYHRRILLTRKALQGDPTEKYEKSLIAPDNPKP